MDTGGRDLQFLHSSFLGQDKNDATGVKKVKTAALKDNGVFLPI